MLRTLPYSFLASSIKSGYLQKMRQPSKWCIQCYFRALFKWYFRALFKWYFRALFKWYFRALFKWYFRALFKW
jgi:hypothetical protein